ncbi:hypothetical protein TrST_g1542 [Triparma strigata]|uniref:5-oxoprolinase n=1 Tax=Triparma strigata TaxID=1606541 RepID=A0A9W7BVR0_9STRA|nr:hypothetical protein TrST_g1542 [Triparma strigata]
MSLPDLPMIEEGGKFEFSIDRGGTFTDVFAVIPTNPPTPLVTKLLSEDPSNYKDAPTEGIRRILSKYDTPSSGLPYTRFSPINSSKISSLRMGTTVATNALLERKGAPVLNVITKGFRDLLEIGNQSRPDIFDLSIDKLGTLYESTIEVDERVRLLDSTLPSPPTSNPTFTTVTGEVVEILRPLSLPSLRPLLLSSYNSGLRAVSITLMHSFLYPDHEIKIGDLCKEIGFTQISLSHSVQPMIKIVSRGQTTTASAYLTPSITTYLTSFLSGFDEDLKKNASISFMRSDGGLTSVKKFQGHQAILSGPAGGVVGYAKTSYRKKEGESDSDIMPCIGFDMGGTSTDVSRYDGELPIVFESTTAGVTIQTPQLDINTVAAGGGSRLFLRGGDESSTAMLVVGPESAGSEPGPVSYRKKGGLLAVTDANVVLGRVIPSRFPNIFGPEENQPLDVEGSIAAFQSLIDSQSSTQLNGMTTPEDLAFGFLKVANEAMCRPIRNLTQMKGFDIQTHCLSCFGGAGPQHACAIAKSLGMNKVHVHRYGGILSAYGLSLSDAVSEVTEPAKDIFNVGGKEAEDSKFKREERFKKLVDKCKYDLSKQGYSNENVEIHKYLNLRYEGTDTSIFTSQKNAGLTDFYDDYATTFSECYQREFGFDLKRDVIVDDYRVRCVVKGPGLNVIKEVKDLGEPEGECKAGESRAFFEDGWHDVNVWDMDKLRPGHSIQGPAIIVQSISTVVVEIGCLAKVTSDGDVEIIVSRDKVEKGKEEKEDAEAKEDPVMLSIFGHRFMGIAESMGKTLARTSVSVNIKERLDFSCALFDPEGGLVANAPHIPVHLGAMQSAVSFQIKYWKERGGMKEGDVFVSNHPQLAGGSHLPDITVITPVFQGSQIVFFVASRGHHSDIGGIAPGSMPPQSTTLIEEGAQIVACKLVIDGVFQEAAITELLEAPGKLPGNFGTRNLRDNLSDLRAQVAANTMGIRLVRELIAEYDLKTVMGYMRYIQKTAEISVRTMLKQVAASMGTTLTAEDYMDDGSPIKLRVDIDGDSGDAVFDFTGTGPQVLGNHNAPPSVTYSAVIYSLRCLVGSDIPLNQGCLAPITFNVPKGTLLNPSADAAVVGGNVLTSQRLCDVVLKAFQACAASQGCMNNLTFGNENFGYYETIAGGHGAGPTWSGKSGVHTHMTNTRITDPEILERRYPVMLHAFEIRKGSGGKGVNPGGDGLTRVIEPLTPLTMSILSERRSRAPYGLMGGGDGACGINLIQRGGEEGQIINVGGKKTTNLNVGDRLIIHTPGGGGWGVEGEGAVGGDGGGVDGGGGGRGFIPVGNGSLATFTETQFGV